MNRERGIKDTFFSGRNRQLLESLIEKNLTKQCGELTIRDRQRIQKSTDHYIREVFDVQGQKPIAFLNKEVITAVETDVFQKKIKDYESTTISYNQVQVKTQRQPQYQQQQQQPQQIKQKKQVTFTPSAGTPIIAIPDNNDLFLEPGQRFEEHQKVRNEGKPTPKNIPDFTLPLDDDGAPSAMDLFNAAKARREHEMLLNSTTSAANSYSSAAVAVTAETEQIAAVLSQPDFPTPRIDDSFIQGTPISQQQQQKQTPIIVKPALTAKEKGIGNSNPTLATPAAIQLNKEVLPQQIVIKEPSNLQYKEVESNLILSSADRNWLINTQENRYNFSVQFDPGQRQLYGFAASPAAQKRFKNITRIEFVKAILPAESLDVLVYKDISALTAANIQTTALSYPQILLRIAEFDGNNFGTDEQIDNAFSILQYDANWISDATTGSKGYLAMIPKFLKCQRIYQPTPLATLQKLSLRLERPNGKLLDTTSDTFDMSGIIGSEETSILLSNYYTAAAPSEFIFIETRKYFPHFLIQRGDRIQIRAFSQLPSSPTPNELAAINELADFINRDDGHLVCDVAYRNSIGSIVDGWNSVGYANFIIIRSKQEDPTTGSESSATFGPNTSSGTYALTQPLQSGRGINLNHQLQLVFRIITRELDATSHVRPDNLN